MKSNYYSGTDYFPSFYPAAVYNPITTTAIISDVPPVKPKIFYIHGNDTNKIKQKAENYLLREEALCEFAKVINIGTRDQGFDPLTLTSDIAKHLTPQDKKVIILMNFHGAPYESNGNLYYELSAFKQGLKHHIITGHELFQIIVSATGDKPVLILNQSCHSSLLQKDLSSLSVGSVLITMGNEDESTCFEDTGSNITDQLLEAVFNTNDGFKLENLLVPLCLNQHIMQNNPMLGLKGKEKDISASIEMFINPNIEDLPLAQKMFELKGVPLPYVKNLLNDLNNNPPSKSIIPQEFYLKVNSLISESKYEDVEQALNQVMDKYYYVHKPIRRIKETLKVLKQKMKICEEIVVNEQILEIEQSKIELLLQQDKDFEEFDNDFFEKFNFFSGKLKSLNDAEEFLNSQRKEFDLLKDSQVLIMNLKKPEKELIEDISCAKDLLSITSQVVQCLKDNLKFLQALQKSNENSLEIYRKALLDNGLLDAVNPEATPNYSIVLTVGAATAAKYIDAVTKYDPNFNPYFVDNSQLAGVDAEPLLQ